MERNHLNERPAWIHLEADHKGGSKSPFFFSMVKDHISLPLQWPRYVNLGFSWLEMIE